MLIAVAQIKIVTGNPVANANTMIQMAREITDGSDVNVIVYPELSIPGYLLGDMWEEQSFLIECEYAESLVKKFATDNDITMIYGSIAVDWAIKHTDGRVRKYNVVKSNDHDGVVATKSLLPNYREFDEPRHFTKRPSSGDHAPWSLRGEHVGFSICEDAWDGDYPVKDCPMESFKNHSIDLLINHSCSPFTIGKNARRNVIFGQHAKTHNCPLIYVNAVGTQNNGKTVYTFDGCSVLYNRKGEVVYQIPMFETGYFIYDTLIGEIVGNVNSTSLPTVPNVEIGDIYKSLVYGIREYCATSGIKQVVIGSSGGVDSAVSAALHCQAIGSDNVFLVNMPSVYNSETTRGLSQQLATNLGTMYAVVPISDSVELTKKQIEGLEFCKVSHGYESIDPIFDFKTITLSELNIENIQARDRSSRILSAISSAIPNCVFSNNGNKAETTVGYSTLYGDGAGYLAVIADLWKEQVYTLGRFINHLAKRELIPVKIFELVPSAELSDSQNVDAGNGDPLIYWYHDRLFKSWVQDWNRKSPEEILEWYIDGTLGEKLDFPTNEFGERRDINTIFPTALDFIADLERWWKTFKGMGVVKRVQGPPVLAVSKRAFGFDYRESLNCLLFTTRYKDIRRKLLEP